MPNPTAAMLVIGDEILSGRTRDSNAHYLANQLTAKGVDLCEVRFVPDVQSAIVAAVKSLSASYDHLFTSGGIGPTHDDITADAIAAAFDAHIDVRDDAAALLRGYFAKRGTVETPARMRMARIPDGADLIDNPVSIAPGFTMGNVHVMAGVPAVFEAMVQTVLPLITGGKPMLSQSWRVAQGEGVVAEPLGKLAAEFPNLSIGSYPYQQNGIYGTNLVVRGQDGAEVNTAMQKLAALFPEEQP